MAKNKQSRKPNKQKTQYISYDKKKRLKMKKEQKQKNDIIVEEVLTTNSTDILSEQIEQVDEIASVVVDVPIHVGRITKIGQVIRVFRSLKYYKYVKMCMALLLLLTGGYVANFVVSLRQAIKDIGDGDTPEVVEIQDLQVEPFNILFIGLGTNGKDGEQPLADSINIFSVNPQENYAEAIAIPRDAYLPFGSSCEWGVGYFDKITHATGVSPACLQNTLSDVFGIKINYYVSVDFNGFVGIVDALGGIEMKVPNLIEAFNAYEDPKLKPELKTGTQWCEHDSKRRRYRVCFDKFGKQTVTGEQALALARSRHYDGDSARNLRQTELIKAILDKAISPSSIVSVAEILRIGGQAVTTNIPVNQFLSFFTLAQKLLLSDNEQKFEMRTTQLGGYDELLYGDRLGEELYFRVVPTTSIYNISKKMWHATHDGAVVVSPETFDFSIEDDPVYDDINFFYDPKLHDETVYDYSQRWAE